MNVLVFALLAVTAAAPDTQVVPLPEIVVTGVRLPEPALRIPAAISVVDRGRFADTRAIGLADALVDVPGVLVQSRSGAQDARISIRGFGARGSGERSNTAVMRGIRVLSDGVPVTEPDGRTAPDLLDLGSADRIEVSRSNASALYGNATGGVINVRTLLDFTSPYLEVSGRAGPWGYHREQGIVGFLLGRGNGLLSAANSTFDGWRDHSGSLATQAKARFRAPLDDRTRLGVLLDFVSDLNRFPGALTAAERDSAPQQANTSFVSRNDRRRNRIGRVALTLDREEDRQELDLMVFAEPKVLQRSERGRFRDFNRYHIGGSSVYARRARIAEGLESRLSLGADDAYQDGSVQFYDLGPGGSRGINPVANKREGSNSAGGFLQEELTWNGRWSVRAALRYDNLWYVSEDFMEPSLDATRHFTRFTPKGSLSYQAGAHTVYASLGGGVEAPAFNEIDPPPSLPTTSLNPFLEPMRSTSWELGAKGRAELPGSWGALRYDVALYWIDVANDIVPWDGGAYFFTAGKSRRKGVELGLDWAATPRLSLAASGTFSANEYVTYVNSVSGVPHDYSGNDIAGLPATVVSGGVRWRDPSGLSLETTLRHVGPYFADDASLGKVEAHTLLGASAGWSWDFAMGSLRLFLAGDNLTDRDYVSSVFINGVNGQYYEPGLPRNWSTGLTLRWK